MKRIRILITITLSDFVKNISNKGGVFGWGNNNEATILLPQFFSSYHYVPQYTSKSNEVLGYKADNTNLSGSIGLSHTISDIYLVLMYEGISRFVLKTKGLFSTSVGSGHKWKSNISRVALSASPCVTSCIIPN